MSKPKTKPTERPVFDFLEHILDDSRRKDCLVIAELMRKATGSDPVMWGDSIVGFGRYRYQNAAGKGSEWPIIGFSPRKTDLTLYIMPGFERYQDVLKRLGKHKTGKSCLYLKKLADVDLGILKELIDLSVSCMASKRVDK